MPRAWLSSANVIHLPSEGPRRTIRRNVVALIFEGSTQVSLAKRDYALASIDLKISGPSCRSQWKEASGCLGCRDGQGQQNGDQTAFGIGHPGILVCGPTCDQPI